VRKSSIVEPMGPVERQGSLADLLFEILDDEDTDDLLLADLNKSSRAAANVQQQQQQQLRTQLTAGSAAAAQPQQTHLLQQLQQRKLLKRLQASKQQGEIIDIYTVRDPLSSATTSSLAASNGLETGTSVTPWQSFTSPAGQPGPGPAVLLGGGSADPAVQGTGTAVMQLGAQGMPAPLPALKAAAGVAEGALLERQALKRQLNSQQQQQQAGQDVVMTAAADAGQQPGGNNANAAAATGVPSGAALVQHQQQQQQGDAVPAAEAAAAAGDAAAAAPGDGIGNCSAATAAALLAESGDDLAFDLDFLESMLQVGLTD
jgi:hypothetical protein